MSLVCYTVDSDSDSEMEEEQEVKVKLEPVEYTAEETVASLMEEILTSVFTCTRDFSDMFIKEEPLDEDDIKEEIFAEYRTHVKVELETDSEDSSDEDVVVTSIKEEDIKEENVNQHAPRSKNELRLCDLPPVEELNVVVPADQVVKIGVVSSSVEELVVVESCPGNPALDLESVLFLDSGARVLGRVFDVIGPVQLPYYCVRFNSSSAIEEAGIQPGQDVYYAPKSELTTFVFLEQLMKLKISDASWKDDEEPPPQFLDYSDDEQEKTAKQHRVIDKMIQSGATDDEVKRKRAKFDGSRKRAQQQDGNQHYNHQRHDNGLYNPSVNPFYRQERRYNPRESGQITWNNYNTGNQGQSPNYNGGPGYYTEPRSFQGYQNGHDQQQQYSHNQQQSSYSRSSPQYNQHPNQQYNYNCPPPSNIRWSHQRSQPPPPPPPY